MLDPQSISKEGWVLLISFAFEKRKIRPPVKVMSYDGAAFVYKSPPLPFWYSVAQRITLSLANGSHWLLGSDFVSRGLTTTFFANL